MSTTLFLCRKKKNLYILIYILITLNHSFLVGPGDYSKKFQKGRRRLGVQSLVLLYIIFHTTTTTSFICMTIHVHIVLQKLLKEKKQKKLKFHLIAINLLC